MRLFFGLSLPGDVRAVTRACAESAALSIPGRYPPAENHHVTLAFLGEVPPERLPAARDVLARCAAAFPAPTLTLQGFDCFGRRTNGILIHLCQISPIHIGCVFALQERVPAAMQAFAYFR